MIRLLNIVLFVIIINSAVFAQFGGKRVRSDTLISFTPSSFVVMNDSLLLKNFLESDSIGTPVSAISFGRSRLIFRGTGGIFYRTPTYAWRLDTNYASVYGKILRVLESDGSPSVNNVDSLHFNSTNFSLTNPSGNRVAVNTVQDINTSSNFQVSTLTTSSASTAITVTNGGSIGMSGGTPQISISTSPGAGAINLLGTTTGTNKNVTFAATTGTVAVVGDAPASVTSTGHIQIDTSRISNLYNTKVDSIYRTPGKDSIQFTINGRYHAIRDSVGGGGGGSLRVLESDGSPSIANVDSIEIAQSNGLKLTNPSATRAKIEIDSTSSPVLTGGRIKDTLSVQQVFKLPQDGSYLSIRKSPTAGEVFYDAPFMHTFRTDSGEVMSWTYNGTTPTIGSPAGSQLQIGQTMIDDATHSFGDVQGNDLVMTMLGFNGQSKTIWGENDLNHYADNHAFYNPAGSFVSMSFSTGGVTNYKNISTVGNGIPAEYALVDLTGQTAAITATTIYAVPSNTTYRISWTAAVTRAATTSSILGGAGGFQIVYTDVIDNVVKTMPGTIVTGVETNATNSTSTGTISGCYVIAAKGSTNIQYQIGYTSVGATTMEYHLRIIVEAL